MAKKDPAFLLYSQAWLEGTASLYPDEKGVYIDLLCHQHQKGSLPADEKKLARLVGLSKEDFSKIWVNLKEKFIERPQQDGSNMEARPKQIYNQKLSEVISERTSKAEVKKIIGAFGAVMKSCNEHYIVKQQIKNSFNYKDFVNVADDLLTPLLHDYLRLCLAKLKDKDKDGIKGGVGEKELMQSNFDFGENLKKQDHWVSTTGINHGLNVEEVFKSIDKFVNHLNSNKYWKLSENDFLRHYNNWMNGKGWNNKTDEPPVNIHGIEAN